MECVYRLKHRETQSNSNSNDPKSCNEPEIGICIWISFVGTRARSMMHRESASFAVTQKKRDRTFGPMPGAGGDFRCSQQRQSKNDAHVCGEWRDGAGARCGAAPTRNWAATEFWN